MNTRDFNTQDNSTGHLEYEAYGNQLLIYNVNVKEKSLKEGNSTGYKHFDF